MPGPPPRGPASKELEGDSHSRGGSGEDSRVAGEYTYISGIMTLMLE